MSTLSGPNWLGTLFGVSVAMFSALVLEPSVTQSGISCSASRKACLFVSLSSVCAYFPRLRGVCSRLSGSSFSSALSGPSVSVPTPFGSGSLAFIHDGHLNHGMFAQFASCCPSFGVDCLVSSRVVVGPSVAPSKSSKRSFGKIISRRRFAVVSARPMAERFGGVSRSRFGSTSLRLAVGQVGLVIGPYCKGIASGCGLGGAVFVICCRILPPFAGLMKAEEATCRPAPVLP